jgi:Sulfotransferase domain
MKSVAFRLARGAAWLVGPRGVQQRAAQRMRYEAYRWFAHDPRADDIFIATYPKSGTTLMQMMLYQLTTDGSMDFDHIGERVPWFEVSAARNPAALARLPSPRAFKSHLVRERLPRIGRFIYVVRNVKDVAVSYHHHAVSLMGWDDDFDGFLKKFVAGKVPCGSWFDHLESWWPHRNDPNTLFMRYEDLVADLPRSVRRVAEFCELGPGAIDRAGERCQLSYMKQHFEKFDPRLFVPRGAPLRSAGFLRRGVAGGWREERGDWSLIDERARAECVPSELNPTRDTGG